MADADLHSMFSGISGRMGGFVFKKRNGKVYISQRPDFSKRKLSAAQKKHIDKFREAVAHAKATMKKTSASNSNTRKPRKGEKSNYNAIIAEYLKRNK
ncbi:MAG: hypothetical protein ACKVRP_12735 [Bacteroidota bacterium]